MTVAVEDAQQEQSSLSNVFALSAIGGLASWAFLGAAAPLTLALGAVAAVSGIVAATEKFAGDKSDIVLASMFTAAATTFVLGFPMDFARELVLFPTFHETALGATLTQWSGEYVIPAVNEIGSWFGVESYSEQLAEVPTVNIP